MNTWDVLNDASRWQPLVLQPANSPNALGAPYIQTHITPHVRPSHCDVKLGQKCRDAIFLGGLGQLVDIWDSACKLDERSTWHSRMQHHANVRLLNTQWVRLAFRGYLTYKGRPWLEWSGWQVGLQMGRGLSDVQGCRPWLPCAMSQHS